MFRREERQILNNLWSSGGAPGERYRQDCVAHLPEPARRYIEHAITPGAPLARSVRLRMRGSIKLGRWVRFEAEQVIHAGRGFMWAARVPLLTISLIRGFDRLLDGAGEMRWKLLGVVPIMSASGADITRSAVGRMEAESLWLPTMLVRDDVQWTARDGRHAVATFRDSNNSIDFAIDAEGRLTSVSLQRWGSPDGRAFRFIPFGGCVEEERTFDGYTIPTRVRVGWYFGSPRFDAEGEFFRATIEQATFR